MKFNISLHYMHTARYIYVQYQKGYSSTNFSQHFCGTENTNFLKGREQLSKNFGTENFY